MGEEVDTSWVIHSRVPQAHCCRLLDYESHFAKRWKRVSTLAFLQTGGERNTNA